MTIREIINGLEDVIIRNKEEIAKLKEELRIVTEEKSQLERELHSLKRKQSRPDTKVYMSPEVKLFDNGDSDEPVVEETPEKPKRSRKKKEVVEPVEEQEII